MQTMPPIILVSLVLAQLDHLPPVDSNDVIVCHCSNAPAWNRK
jgi:hypothetical protein